MANEKALRRQLREMGYYLKASSARTKGTAVEIGEDYGLFQITDGNHVVAGDSFNMSLGDVTAWIAERERNDEWLRMGDVET